MSEELVRTTHLLCHRYVKKIKAEREKQLAAALGTSVESGKLMIKKKKNGEP
jgi:hypothetical protein